MPRTEDSASTATRNSDQTEPLSVIRARAYIDILNIKYNELLAMNRQVELMHAALQQEPYIHPILVAVNAQFWQNNPPHDLPVPADHGYQQAQAERGEWASDVPREIAIDILQIIERYNALANRHNQLSYVYRLLQLERSHPSLKVRNEHLWQHPPENGDMRMILPTPQWLSEMRRNQRQVDNGQNNLAASPPIFRHTHT